MLDQGGLFTRFLGIFKENGIASGSDDRHGTQIRNRLTAPVIFSLQYPHIYSMLHWMDLMKSRIYEISGVLFLFGGRWLSLSPLHRSGGSRPL